MRRKILAFSLAVIAMIAVVLFAILTADDEEEVQEQATAPTPRASASPAPPATPAATPEAREPTFAPDGRTGIPELDAIIDDFVTLDAEALAETYGDVPAREFPSDGDPDVEAERWTGLLGKSERSLYAVFLADPDEAPGHDYNVVLSVTPAGQTEALGWRVAVKGTEAVEVLLGTGSSPSAWAPGVSAGYERFLVLPPQQRLPQPPASHPLDTVTGDARVDAIVALIAARDVDGLLALADAPLSSAECGRHRRENDDRARAALREAADLAIGLHAVAVAPEGYLPAADHVIILVSQPAPYRWYVPGILERDGRIVGVDGCESEIPQLLYPPLSYSAPPLADLADLDTGRRAGIEVIDSFLDALRAEDLDAMLDLVSYQQVGCIVEPVGIGGPPFCEEGEAEGTVLDVIPAGQCEGFYMRREELRDGLHDLAGKPWAIFAVIEPGPVGEQDVDYVFLQSTWQVLLTDTEPNDDGSMRSIALGFEPDGLRNIAFGCGPASPDDLANAGISPDFLLPPP
jgi:hypothetical protein